MPKMSIHTSETNHRRHRVRLEESQIQALLARAVADQVQVDLEAVNVTVRVHLGSDSGSLTIQRYAEVEITEDFSAQKG